MAAMNNGAVSREGGRLSVRTSIPRTALMACGSALLAAGSGAICAAWFVTLPEQAAEMSIALLIVARLFTLPILIVGLAGVVLFGYGLLFFLGRLLFFRRPVFEVGPDGILDRTSAVSAGFVPWEEVKVVMPGRFGYHNTRILTIRVKNTRRFLERQNPVKRFVMRVNREYFTGAAVNIPFVGLPISQQQVLAEIEPHLSPTDRRLLAEFRTDEGADGHTGRAADGDTDSGSTPARTVLRIAGAMALGIALFVLSMIYYAITAGLVGFGVAMTWNSIGPGRAAELAHPVAGVILSVLGIAWFIFFPRVVKKLTGREVISTPYS